MYILFIYTSIYILFVYIFILLIMCNMIYDVDYAKSHWKTVVNVYGNFVFLLLSLTVID